MTRRVPGRRSEPRQAVDVVTPAAARSYDVIVVGGSYAGMAAALQLARARRTVLLIDAGQRRNRVSSHSYGFLGCDGEDPASIAGRARKQLTSYPTLAFQDGTVATAERDGTGFAVTLADGTRHAGDRLILAVGVTDRLPDLPGVEERWGKAVFACPYCHGYELDRGAIAVVSTGDASLSQALLLTEWGPVTFFPDGSRVPREGQAELRRRGVTLERGRIAEVSGASDIVLRDGRVLPFAGIFVATTTAPSSPIAAALGCAMDDTEHGSRIVVDHDNETSVPGIFACGDATSTSHSVAGAVGDGAATGIAVHRALAFP